MFIIYLHTKHPIPGSNGPTVNSVKMFTQLSYYYFTHTCMPTHTRK